jgi:hypothetical protein
MRRDGGQATVEWVGLVLLVAVALAGAVAFVPLGDRTLGEASRTRSCVPCAATVTRAPRAATPSW